MSTLRTKLLAVSDRFVSPFDRSLELFLASKRIVENFSAISDQFPETFGFLSVAVRGTVFVMALAITLYKMIGMRSELIITGLNAPASPKFLDTKPRSAPFPKRTNSEVDYFNMLFATAKKGARGDRYICSIWTGIKLHCPVGNALQVFAEICARRDLRPEYIFNFTNAEFARLTADDLGVLSRRYAFAEMSIVIHDDQINSRYGVSLRTRFHIVLAPEQRIAYTHRRDDNGFFTTAVTHTGDAFEFHHRVVAGLMLLRMSVDQGIAKCRLRALQKEPAYSFFPEPESVVHV